MQSCIFLQQRIGSQSKGKALRLLSISAMAQAERQQVIEICTGIADSVVYVRVVRPTALSMLAFQVGILEATLSTSRCSSALIKRDSDSGAPR